MKWVGPELQTAGLHLIMPLGQCTETVEIAVHRFKVKFVIFRVCARDVILGMDFLSENKVIIDLQEGMILLW